ncbi:MAG: hypothetical protein AAFX00_07625 [Pseudomonadota bacterium]
MMCLSAEALELFLKTIGMEKVTATAERIIVHATEGDVVYILNGVVWCIV